MIQPPIFIVVRDLLSPLQQLVNWLERAGHDRIVLVDNDSTYPPMVEYLSATPHTVVRCGWNMGHRSPWLSGAIFEMAHDEPYIVSDPDIVPDDKSWTWVLERVCGECSFDVRDFEPSELGAMVRANATEWALSLIHI